MLKALSSCVSCLVETNLGGGFKYFLFSSQPGKMIQFDDHIFQMDWFNHQPPPRNGRK